MKILFLLTQDLESPSGLGRYWPMARAMAAHGHSVRIATLHSNWSNLKSKREIKENVAIAYVAPMHVMKIGDKKKYFSSGKLIWIALRATVSLFKTAFFDKADIIYIGKPHPMNSIAGIVASRLRNKILCLDCDDYEAGSNRFGNQLQKTIVAFFEKKTPHCARLVTTNTFFMKSNLVHWNYPANHILYLPNGIDRERFQKVELAEILQLTNSLSITGKRVILYLGSLSLSNHPVDLLLKAIKIVSHTIPEVLLLIVGGGEDYQKLINQANDLGIREQTQFIGRVSPEKVPLYYAIAELSVDPVYDDPAARGRSPLKLFESWVCGVPFVTSPVGDRQFLLGDPPAGLLVEPAGDANSLAAGIIQVLNSAELAESLRSRGIEKVKSYSWDQLTWKLEQELQQLL